MAIDFGSKEVEPMLDEGAIHGQPTYCLGIVKTVRVDHRDLTVLSPGPLPPDDVTCWL